MTRSAPQCGRNVSNREFFPGRSRVIQLVLLLILLLYKYLTATILILNNHDLAKFEEGFGFGLTKVFKRLLY